MVILVLWTTTMKEGIFLLRKFATENLDFFVGLRVPLEHYGLDASQVEDTVCPSSATA